VTIFRNKNIQLILLALLFILSRVIFLDSDIPIWEIAEYQSIDEFYYTLGGFNLFHYSIYNYITFDFLNESKYVTNWLEDFFTFISLSLFDNNYYGLRMASVFSGATVIIIINYILYKSFYTKKSKNFYYLLVFISFYMIIDFSYILSNRIAEATIFRMITMMLLFLAVIAITQYGINKRKSFLVGFLTFTAFIYVYTTNLFLIPAIGLAVMIISYKNSLQETFFNILIRI